MTRVRVLCVGRKARDPLLEAADSYVERINRYCGMEIVRVRDGTPKEERSRLLAHLKKCSGRIVALDERGKSMTSTALADNIRQAQNDGLGQVTYVIGGADGLDPDVSAKADAHMRLSDMTLPHRMALVVLVEQIYRAHTILRGEKYHRV